MPLAAGTLRHMVRVERKDKERDSDGNVVQSPSGQVSMTWQALPGAPVRARIRPMSVREFVQSSALQSKITTSITLRRTVDILPTDRIIHVRVVAGVRTEVVYDIEGVLDDPDAGIEYVTLACGKGVNQG